MVALSSVPSNVIIKTITSVFTLFKKYLVYYVYFHSKNTVSSRHLACLRLVGELDPKLDMVAIVLPSESGTGMLTIFTLFPS